MASSSRSTRVAEKIVSSLNDSERDELLGWARGMVVLHEAKLSKTQKTKQALQQTMRSRVAVTVVKMLSRSARQIGWTERNWASRIGLGAALGTAAVLGSEGAGIAALGGAIGVPLWMVFGAGGAFAGVLIDEIERRRVAATVRVDPEQQALQSIPEADFEVLQVTRELKRLPHSRGEAANDDAF